MNEDHIARVFALPPWIVYGPRRSRLYRALWRVRHPLWALAIRRENRARVMLP